MSEFEGAEAQKMSPYMQQRQTIQQRVPREAPTEMMATIIVCLLKNRAEEYKTAIASLVAERHRHFHVSAARPEEDWHKCTNPVCCQYGRLLQKSSEPEAVLSSMELQMASGMRVMFEIQPGALRVYAVEKSRIEQPRIIVP